MNSKFNLLDEPWIRVRTGDGVVISVSLTDALINSYTYQELSGDSPQQDAAVFRLLLAVLYTVFSRYDADGVLAPIEEEEDALDRWESLWNDKRIPAHPITDYLTKWKERFYLFDDDHPFYQVSEAQRATQYGVPKLLGTLVESGNKLRLFPSHSGSAKQTLSYDEAARWLLYLNLWDDTALKKTRGMNLAESAAKGWLGNLGYISACGDNLFESLMLNLVLIQDGEKLWNGKKCIPAWELDTPKTDELSRIPMPQHPAALLTTQFRRILLTRDSNAVTGYHLFSGDLLDTQNVFAEQQTLWTSYSDHKTQRRIYIPKTHDASRQLWRDFTAVSVKSDHAPCPGIVRWIQLLQKERILPSNQLIRFQIAAVGYDGTASHAVQDGFSDSLTFHSNLLTEKGKNWCNEIELQIQRCEKAASAVESLMKNLCKASGMSSEDEKSLSERGRYAKEQLFSRIDISFRAWLGELSAEQSTEEVLILIQQWQQTARKIVLELGRELVQQTGHSAFIGRTYTLTDKKGKEQSKHFSSPEAYNQFTAEIYKIYPRPDKEGRKNA